MLPSSITEKSQKSSYVAPPYKNIFGTVYEYRQLSLPIYYSFADCTSSSEIQFVLNIDEESLMKWV